MPAVTERDRLVVRTRASIRRYDVCRGRIYTSVGAAPIRVICRWLRPESERGVGARPGHFLPSENGWP